MKDDQLELLRTRILACGNIHELSRQSGVSRPTIHNILNRGRIPHFRQIVKLCDLLGLSLSLVETGEAPHYHNPKTGGASE